MLICTSFKVTFFPFFLCLSSSMDERTNQKVVDPSQTLAPLLSQDLMSFIIIIIIIIIIDFFLFNHYQSHTSTACSILCFYGCFGYIMLLLLNSKGFVVWFVVVYLPLMVSGGGGSDEEVFSL
ncbi:hypothetical protein IC582_021114 [Cucumis melo]